MTPPRPPRPVRSPGARRLALTGSVAVLTLAACDPQRLPRPIPSDGGHGAPDFGLGDVASSVGGRLCKMTPPLPIQTRPADVLIVFDRSGSMSAAFGTSTRYEVEAALLNAVLPLYEAKIRFGYQQFPAKTRCGPGVVPGCCAEPPAVPVALHQARAISAAIAGAAPVDGNTPTARALGMARAYFTGLDDGVVERYVLLATDGRPSCTADGRLPDDDVAMDPGDAGAPDAPPDAGPTGAACADALAEVEALRAMGVRVIVLGVGPGLESEPDGTPSCLATLAARGGVDRGAGVSPLFSAADPDALERALEQIFGGVTRPSCNVSLEQAPGDRSLVRVLLDGREIPRSRIDGWDFDPPQDSRSIRVFGRHCHRLERFGVAQIEVQFGCAPCESCE